MVANVKASADVVDAVIRARRAGANKLESAQAAGIHRMTLDRWLRACQRGRFAFADFLERFERIPLNQ